MKSIEKLLLEKRQQLQRIIKMTQSSVEAPHDRLRISSFGKYTRYYLIRHGDTGKNEIYLGKGCQDRVKELARLDYEKKLHEAAVKQAEMIDRFLREYNENELITVYSKLPEVRRELIQPLILDDDAYAERWQAEEYVGKEIPLNTTSYVTAAGEKVRSKSEKIIADYYRQMKIPYRYECPLKLKDGRKTLTLHPDFTVLNKKTRQVFYHEHFGKMDDPEYCQTQLDRVELYKKNDIYPGEKLLITHETGLRPIDLHSFEKMAAHYLL